MARKFMGVSLLVVAFCAVMFLSPAVQAEEPVNAGNKICPVTGEKIGEMGKPVHYEYEGKVYNLCCEGCVQTFKENPEKYVNDVETSMSKEKTDHMDHHMGKEASSM